VSSKRAVRSLLVAAGLVVTVVCTYVAVRGVELDEARVALANCDLTWLLPSGIVFAGAIWLRALRWWAVFAPEKRPPLPQVTRALFIGFFFNNILPARAGEAARIIALHSATGTPRAEAIGTAVVERVFDILALLILLFAAYPLLPEVSWLRTGALFGAGALVALAGLVYVLVRYDERAVRWLLSPLRRLPGTSVTDRIEHAVVNATRGLTAIRDPRVALRGMAITLVSWIGLGVSYWILMFSFSLDVPIVAGILVTVAINLSLVLPSSPAALGVFEAATVIALRAFDVPQAEALSYALVLHLVNLLPFLAIGLGLLGPGMLRRRRRSGRGDGEA
jgi:glycosyltransferase 2 family protein